MTLVNGQNSIAFLFPSKLSSSRRTHSPTSSTSSGSSRSSSPSIYSFTRTSQESSPDSEASCSSASTAACSPTFLGQSKTRTSCLSEFCCNCANYHCTLSRRTHIRHRSKPIARVIRPLPQIPIPPARLLPRPTGVRKLPSLPPRSQSTSQLSQQLPHRSSLPNPLAISATDSLDRHDSKPKSWDPGYFAPEIDWDAIMVEIIRGNSRENSDYYDYTDDAESIYTDFVYEE
ncbi:MAG: hypothetical protein NXY57DRAFT_61668 [Lentinula lateritia]|nr:MAG: hypothetical protein NXY57DRAFT_61668 [Lentinula lateritia]